MRFDRFTLKNNINDGDYLLYADFSDLTSNGAPRLKNITISGITDHILFKGGNSFLPPQNDTYNLGSSGNTWGFLNVSNIVNYNNRIIIESPEGNLEINPFEEFTSYSQNKRLIKINGANFYSDGGDMTWDGDPVGFGRYNLFIGTEAGDNFEFNDILGFESNTLLGYAAGKNAKGSYLVSVGGGSMRDVTFNETVFNNNDKSIYSVSIGTDSLRNSRNIRGGIVAVGDISMYESVFNNDVITGSAILDWTTAIGYASGYASSGTQGSVIVGAMAGWQMSGNQGTYIGTTTGYNVNGNRNIAIGTASMRRSLGDNDRTNISESIAIGHNTTSNSLWQNKTNIISIGHDTAPSISNAFVVKTDLLYGFGVNGPQAKMHIRNTSGRTSNVILVENSGATNQIFTVKENSKVNIKGNTSLPVIKVSGDTVLNSLNQTILVYNVNSDINITLPDATGDTYNYRIIKNNDANFNVNILANNIEGLSGVTLNLDNHIIELQSDLTTYNKIRIAKEQTNMVNRYSIRTLSADTVNNRDYTFNLTKPTIILAWEDDVVQRFTSDGDFYQLDVNTNSNNLFFEQFPPNQAEAMIRPIMRTNQIDLPRFNASGDVVGVFTTSYNSYIQQPITNILDYLDPAEWRPSGSSIRLDNWGNTPPKLLVAQLIQ